MRRYRSFLVRWWDLQSGERRIEVEHLQSGERTVVATTAAAVEWIDTQGVHQPGKEAQADGLADSGGERDGARRSGESKRRGSSED